MYRSLAGSKAVAAIFVVLFHLGGTIASEKYFGIAAFSVPFKFGSAGVEFFFVLSGFFIYFAHCNDIFQPKKLVNYVKKRLIRIFPAYWIVFLLVYFLAMLFDSLKHTVPHDAFVLLKSLLLLPQDKTLFGSSGTPVITVAWTLQYEIFFYLLFAVLILSKWLSVIGLVALLFIYANNDNSSLLPLSFFALEYLSLFVMGVLVAMVCKLKKIVIDYPFFYLFVGALIFSIVALDVVMRADILINERTFLYGFASSLIIFGLVQGENKDQIIFKHKWMQILGDSSYALYLIHYPLISLFCKLALAIRLNNFGVLGAAITYFSTFISCLIISIIFHLKLEKPILEYFRSKIVKPI